MKTHRFIGTSRMIIGMILIGLVTLSYSQSTESVLQSFVDSYKRDAMALTCTFGIKVGDEWYHVKSVRKQEGYLVGKSKNYTFHNYGPHEVTLEKGQPESPTWFFEFADRETLDKINNKIWTASTASAKSTGADVVALNIREMPGMESSIKADAIGYVVMEHFWKKDQVEITRFSRDGSLPTHGVDHVGLYTMKDKRIGWFSIGKDQTANADRGLDKGQVPNLFIFTKGRGKADFGNGEVDLEAGMSVFVGPYVKHVFWNPYDEPIEGVVVLFGDNIDFARGQSYLDLIDLQNDSYDVYDAKMK